MFKNRVRTEVSRFTSLRRDILFPAIAAIISVLLIELYLNTIPARNDLLYNLGQIYLKFCYSFSAAVLFYYVVVHLPLERKKAKLYRYIRNKVVSIDTEVNFLFNKISDTSNLSIDKRSSSESDYNNACARINPQYELQTFEYNRLSNWFDYISLKCNRIKELTFELIAVGDAINPDLLQALTYLDDRVSSIRFSSVGKPANLDLTFLSNSIYEMVQNANRVLDASNHNYEKYLPEHRLEYCSEMSKRKQSNN